MKKLSLYVNAQDYKAFAGPDWPSYNSYLAGIQARDPEVQKNIDAFTTMMVNEGIRFPISTATACQSKWTWSTIYLNQLETASCHRVDPVPLDLDDFDNFHNTPKKIRDRELMLQGQWPTGGCEYCRDIEYAGGWSDRQHNLDIRGLTPPEIENDYSATHVTPRIVEIFAQNTCNLACTYCNSNLSSRIAEENKKYGYFYRSGVSIPVNHSNDDKVAKYFSKFISWLDRNVNHLRRLHLLGGETFLQHELMQSVLQILESHPNPQLEFTVFSNLNVPDKYWNTYTSHIMDLQRRNHIRVFDLTASIDCWGPEQEYARSGIDLDKFERRFAWVVDQDPTRLRLNVNQTVTALTVRSMPDLIRKIAYYGKHRHIGHYFQFYTGLHMFQHPKNFAYSHWADAFSEIFALMPKNTVAQQEAIPRMKGLDALLRTVTEHNYTEIEKLKIYLDELDRRRNTDWRSIFPYLDV